MPEMDPKLKEQLEKMLLTVKTMRKYQKKFFGGDKGAQKTAMYYENQADNDIDRFIIDNRLDVKLPKDPSWRDNKLF